MAFETKPSCWGSLKPLFVEDRGRMATYVRESSLNPISVDRPHGCRMSQPFEETLQLLRFGTWAFVTCCTTLTDLFFDPGADGDIVTS